MQANLFEDTADSGFHEDHVLVDASLREFPRAFVRAECVELLNALLETTPWQQDTLRIAGREIAVPRLQCWMGDPDSRYGYSGIQLEPVAWSDAVLRVRRQIHQLSGVEFNSVLLNYYRNGQDSVAWHADDEAELGPNPVIASVSFGAERALQLRHKTRQDLPRYKLLLRDGSLLLMGNTLQDKWMHQIPKIKGLIDPRVNLTFRTIY